jgi:putative flippase GtrA
MTAIITNQRERSRFLRFAMVGVIGAVVDFGIANLLIYGFGVNLVVAGAVSFICAIISNFVWNRFWTYPDSRSKPIAGQFAQFAIVSVMGLVIRIPVLHFLEPLLMRLFKIMPRFLSFSPDFLGKNVTLAIAVLIVMFWNFFVNRYVTYGDIN